MRHVIVNRVTALVAALFLVAAALFVRIVTPTGDRDAAPTIEAPIGGSALFDAHCASCHAAEDLRTTFEGLPEARRIELERFLADHGEAGPDDDRAIIDYLSRQGARSRD